MTDDEIIAVVQAHKEGKAIESRNAGGVWRACTPEPAWNFQDRDYRVKREPREWWLAIRGDGRVFEELPGYAMCYGALEKVKVREILE